MNWLWFRQNRPRDIPQKLFTTLVLGLGLDGEQLSRLKMVTRRDVLDGQPVNLFRLYDPDNTAGLNVTDFASLDGHPESVRYEGWQDPETGKLHTQSR
jgi:hypothetical protein